MEHSADMAEGQSELWQTRRSLEQAPTLSAICALGAWLAMIIQKGLVPGLHGRAERSLLVDLSLWGEFGANLAAVAGAPALLFALYDYLPPNRVLNLPRRMAAAGLAVIVVGTTVFATYFDRTQRIGEMVFFGLGAAHMLVVVLMMATLLIARTPLDRVLAVAIASAGLFGLMGHVADLFARTRLSLTQTASWLHGFGEVGYLVGLMAIAWALTPTEREGRRGRIRFVTFVVLGASATGLVLAQQNLGPDYALVLYHAQRLRLLLDSSPMMYVVPLAAATSAGVAGLLSRPAYQRQLAIGALLLLSAGYLPQAPVQLLAMALAALLISRAVACRTS